MKRNDETFRDPISELERSEPRPEMPEEYFQQVKAAAREQWLETVRQAGDSSAGSAGSAGSGGRRETLPTLEEPRLTSGRLPLLALAAALLLSVAIVAWLRTAGTVERPSPTLATVATLERALGESQIADSPDAPAQPASKGDGIRAGAIVTTDASSMLALRLTTGASLRIAPSSRVQILDSRLVELDYGQLYFDSAGVQKNAQGPALLEVRAGVAVIRDVGTQLEVYRDSDRLRLRVREGLGQLRVGSRQANAGAGEQLTVAGRDPQQAGELVIERAEFESSIDTWQWILEIAPSFSHDGATLREYLAWVSRETGWQIDTTAPGVAALLEETTCCVETRSPPNQPDEVLSTMDLASRLDGGVLVVFRR